MSDVSAKIINFKSAAGFNRQSTSRLIELFATHRRGQHDAFWYKENGELLSSLRHTKSAVSTQDLAPHKARASTLASELKNFPQYYRLILGYALELSKLGMTEIPVQSLAEYVLKHNLIEAELCDLRRLNAYYLLSQCGIKDQEIFANADDLASLKQRVLRFMGHWQTFAVPNISALYELTHAVFYLSDYGCCDTHITPDWKKSLLAAGAIAYLEDNLDTLSEIAICLAYCKFDVPEIWQQRLKRGFDEIEALPAAATPSLNDNYHKMLMTSWAVSKAAGKALTYPLPAGAGRFVLRDGSSKDGAALANLIKIRLNFDTSDLVALEIKELIWPHIEPETKLRLDELSECITEFDDIFCVLMRG